MADDETALYLCKDCVCTLYIVRVYCNIDSYTSSYVRIVGTIIPFVLLNFLKNKIVQRPSLSDSVPVPGVLKDI